MTTCYWSTRLEKLLSSNVSYLSVLYALAPSRSVYYVIMTGHCSTIYFRSTCARRVNLDRVIRVVVGLCIRTVSIELHSDLLIYTVFEWTFLPCLDKHNFCFNGCEIGFFCKSTHPCDLLFDVRTCCDT